MSIEPIGGGFLFNSNGSFASAPPYFWTQNGSGFSEYYGQPQILNQYSPTTSIENLMTYYNDISQLHNLSGCPNIGSGYLDDSGNFNFYRYKGDGTPDKFTPEYSGGNLIGYPTLVSEFWSPIKIYKTNIHSIVELSPFSYSIHPNQYQQPKLSADYFYLNSYLSCGAYKGTSLWEMFAFDVNAATLSMTAVVAQTTPLIKFFLPTVSQLNNLLQNTIAKAVAGSGVVSQTSLDSFSCTIGGIVQLTQFQFPQISGIYTATLNYGNVGAFLNLQGNTLRNVTGVQSTSNVNINYLDQSLSNSAGSLTVTNINTKLVYNFSQSIASGIVYISSGNYQDFNSLNALLDIVPPSGYGLMIASILDSTPDFTNPSTYFINAMTNLFGNSVTLAQFNGSRVAVSATHFMYGNPLTDYKTIWFGGLENSGIASPIMRVLTNYNSSTNARSYTDIPACMMTIPQSNQTYTISNTNSAITNILNIFAGSGQFMAGESF